ncbi:MAG: hypothetical protein IPK54_10445 [Dokdonella sp.]|uniref:hypothetical protein n=1 Tax=Dokdonella sp. TaxID=2291710 RepID=UPI0025BBDBE7|nr:hypothetical protein [Dokdonella sp.]MBK8123950.1 hypothetical protein [Dokdonella sp.]MBK8184690.1 hypothetical protein [Candidatus Competibacteraceae bacterium]
MKTRSCDYDKITQIHPSELIVFGIPIQSRYGVAYEIKEMVSFCCELSVARLTRYIDSIFYDSKSCCCTIAPTKELELIGCSDVINSIKAIAKETISLFDFDGYVDGMGIEDDFFKESEPNAVVK